MPIVAPTRCVADLKRRRVRLEFDPPGDSAAPWGWYEMRGGVCWPVIGEVGLEGCIVMTGRHVETGVVYVFEEREFVTIDHILDDDEKIRYEGLCTWFPKIWASYFARRFHQRQHQLTTERYEVQVRRCRPIVPKPVWFDTIWDEDETALAVVYEHDAAGRLKFRSRGPVHLEMQEFQAERVASRQERRRVPPTTEYPALHALTCTLVGFDDIGSGEK